jgi:hypothetical protein
MLLNSFFHIVADGKTSGDLDICHITAKLLRIEGMGYGRLSGDFDEKREGKVKQESPQ